MEPVYASVIAAGHTVFALQGLKFTVTGTEHVPPSGGAVLASNHLSYLDFAYIGYAAGKARRRIRFMAKEEVFEHRISGPLMRGMRHIPVDRSAGAGSFRAAVTALKAGEIVGVFPEATISRSLEPKQFKAGAVRMAASAAVPVLPVAIWGSQRVWTKDHPKRLGRTKADIFVSFGAPVTIARRDDFGAATESLAAAIAAMLQQAQQSYPALTGDELAFLPARLGGLAPTPEQAALLDEQEARERSAVAPETN